MMKKEEIIEALTLEIETAIVDYFSAQSPREIAENYIELAVVEAFKAIEVPQSDWHCTDCNGYNFALENVKDAEDDFLNNR